MARNTAITKTAKPVYTVTDQEIFTRLRQEVRRLVTDLEPKRKYTILFKAWFFPSLYILIYLFALVFGSNLKIFFACYILLGLQLVFVFLNIIHDAVHGTIFKSKKANQIYVHLFDLMGANSFIWQLRHVRYHHNYPNVNGWDTDIEQSKLFRVFPDATFSPVHKYQHIYLPLLYPFYLLNWLLVRDFKDFFKKKGIVKKLVHIPRVEYLQLFFFKSVFLFYMIVLPVLVLSITWMQALLAFFIMLFTASIFSLSVLLPPHANIESEFPVPGKNNQLPHSWMMHMMLTTNDIKGNNFFTRFFMGCFNFHVVHHLFPNVNHIYYPELTQTLMQFAEEYHLPYRRFSLLTSLKNHYRLLKQNGIRENFFEETM
jgi:linoleoyl-CoA desaturase